MYSLICIEIVTYILGEDCSHSAALILNVEDTINNVCTATLPILVSRAKIFSLVPCSPRNFPSLSA